jgi:hypothetical protein
VDGDPYLWIDFYRDGPREFEPEDLACLVKALGAEPSISVVADVSGRHPADDQVRSFITAVRGGFQGLAQDDYTDHDWTVQEVRSGCRVQGHPFFDYREGRPSVASPALKGGTTSDAVPREPAAASRPHTDRLSGGGQRRANQVVWHQSHTKSRTQAVGLLQFRMVMPAREDEPRDRGTGFATLRKQ